MKDGCIDPSNILLDEQLRACLTDFGLAKMSDAEGSLSASKVSGTPGFLDPLTMNSRKHSVLSDGFALGITLLMTQAIFLTTNCKIPK